MNRRGPGAEDGLQLPSHAPNNKGQGNETRQPRFIRSDKLRLCPCDTTHFHQHILHNYGYNTLIRQNVQHLPFLQVLIRGTLV